MDAEAFRTARSPLLDKYSGMHKRFTATDSSPARSSSWTPLGESPARVQYVLPQDVMNPGVLMAPVPTEGAHAGSDGKPAVTQIKQGVAASASGPDSAPQYPIMILPGIGQVQWPAGMVPAILLPSFGPDSQAFSNPTAAPRTSGALHAGLGQPSGQELQNSSVPGKHGLRGTVDAALSGNGGREPAYHDAVHAAPFFSPVQFLPATNSRASHVQFNYEAPDYAAQDAFPRRGSAFSPSRAMAQMREQFVPARDLEASPRLAGCSQHGQHNRLSERGATQPKRQRIEVDDDVVAALSSPRARGGKATKAPRVMKHIYNCRRCGQLKKGHVCPVEPDSYYRAFNTGPNVHKNA